MNPETTRVFEIAANSGLIPFEGILLRLPICPRTARALIKDGKIPVVRLGKRVYTTAADIDRYLASLRPDQGKAS